jgi:hypothetical protein
MPAIFGFVQCAFRMLSTCRSGGNAALAEEGVDGRRLLLPPSARRRRVRNRAASTADLLVVGDDVAWCLEVDDECEVRLVVSHAECRRGDQALHFDSRAAPVPVFGSRSWSINVGVVGVSVDCLFVAASLATRSPYRGS